MTDSIWRNRRVFLTGHTGFKGGWLALWLASRGAVVRGYSLDPPSTPNLFDAARIGDAFEDLRGDIRDGARLERVLSEFAPEVVFHLAAQPLVRLSYGDPIGTFETNVIGTARVLDAVRAKSKLVLSSSYPLSKSMKNRTPWPITPQSPRG